MIMWCLLMLADFSFLAKGVGEGEVCQNSFRFVEVF